MNKRILFGILLLTTLIVIIFTSLYEKESEVKKLRKQHAKFFKNHPYQNTSILSKKQRKAKGLPPNAYFEQKYLSEINPNSGRGHKENIYKVQEQLNKLRIGQKVPGDIDNPWVERGPNNVGGRTRALMFDPNDTTNETVFAGGVSGGLWKNTKISLATNKWVRVGIPENLAVSCIVADPNNSKIFYVGTGESYVNGAVNGNGLWKSIDGGNSWTKIFGGISGTTYLDANSTIKINSPTSILGEYNSMLARTFGGRLNVSITGNLVLVDDGIKPTSDGCTNFLSPEKISGKIAVIKRGTCRFVEKVKRAEDAGAIAVIMVNNAKGNPIAMGGDDNSIKIPAVMITKSNGEMIIKAMLSEEVNLTLKKINNNSINATVVPGIQHINDIAIRNNAGTSEVYIAVGESGFTGGVSLGGDSFGLYKSINGTNFTKVNIQKTANGNEYEPNNIEIASDNSIYLSTTRSFVFDDGGGAIFKSTDGSNFDLKYTVSKGDRTEIALSSKNPGVIYVLARRVVSEAPVKIFKTTDDFVTVNDLALPHDADTAIPKNDFTRGQSGYNLLIKVDTNDDDIIYVGGIDLFKSTSGGTYWTQLSHWYGGFGFQDVHSDQHSLAFATSSRMVFGNDGGVYFSDNGGKNIAARNKNYNTSQFYTIGAAPKEAFGGNEYFVAGSQDNGTQLVRDAVAGINSSTLASGGDGAASFFDVDGKDKYYIANYIYNQEIILYNYPTGETIKINKEETSNGDFINQEELDSNLNILYSNYTSDLSIDIMRYSGLLSGRSFIVKNKLTNDMMDSEPSAFKISPYTTTSSKLFVGLKNGKLLKIEKANIGSGIWSEITGNGFVGSVSDIELGETENDIFITMHNYGVKSIWYSNDGGMNWENKEGNLPDIPVKSILQNPLNKNEVIVGTDLGVWKTVNFKAISPNWVQSYNGMSNVPVLDLDLRADNVIFAATYGRGVFSGEFKKGSDYNGDDDGDGIKNGLDNCPTVSNADQKDINENGIGDICDATNISIKTISETCIGQNDGKIIVNVEQTFVSYTVTLKGIDKNEVKKIIDSSLTFKGLKPGNYEVCVKIDDTDYQQCFEVDIIKAKTISLRVAKKQSSRSYTVNISSGTAPYTVYLNGNLIERFNESVFDVQVQESGILEVQTAKSCEGKFKTVIDNVFLKKNPILKYIELLMPNDAGSNINITVFDVTGKMVLKNNIKRKGNELLIPFDSFKTGIYILKLGNDNSTFKILKE